MSYPRLGVGLACLVAALAIVVGLDGLERWPVAAFLVLASLRLLRFGRHPLNGPILIGLFILAVGAFVALAAINWRVQAVGFALCIPGLIVSRWRAGRH